MSGCARQRVRTRTSASRRESIAAPGGMRFAIALKMGLVLSKDLGASLSRYLPVARIELSAINGCRKLRLVSVVLSTVVSEHA